VRAQEKEITSLGADVAGEVREKSEARLRDVRNEQRMFEESIVRFETLKL
jgi:valyl-tRNA synthetase